MNIVKKTLLFAFVLASGAISTGAFPASSSQTVDPNDYPKLTEKELGHIRHLVRMAHQLPGDWSGFGSGWLLTERTMQFQVAFGAMTLALAQHQYTPAYRELYRGAIEAYIEKDRVLESQNNAKTKMIDHLSHELKTPLAVISASCGLLQKLAATQDPQRTHNIAE